MNSRFDFNRRTLPGFEDIMGSAELASPYPYGLYGNNFSLPPTPGLRDVPNYND
jgi:hypothetical protein